MSAPTAETGWKKLSQHKQPVHVWLLPRYYTNPADSVPSPRHGSELHLPPLLAPRCIRASSPGFRHTTRCKTCLREDKAPAHTTAGMSLCKLTLQSSTPNQYSTRQACKEEHEDTTQIPAIRFPEHTCGYFCMSPSEPTCSLFTILGVSRTCKLTLQ